jgi:hypothetical protein
MSFLLSKVLNAPERLLVTLLSAMDVSAMYWSHPNIPTSHSVKLRLSDVVPKIGLKAFRIYITLQFPYFLAGVNSLALSLIVID